MGERSLYRGLNLNDVMKIISYDPETGVFRWSEYSREARHQHKHHGKIAGTVSSSDGYLYITIRQVPFAAARLAFWMMTARQPVGQIDHIDGNRTNNRWANLREAQPWQNICNRSLDRRNKTGHRGVFFDRARGKFAAAIKRNGKKYHLGRYDSFEDAVAAYQAAAPQYHGSFARIDI